MKRHEISEDQLEGIRAARKANKNKKVERRLRALEMRGMGYKNKEITAATALHSVSIGKLVSRYLRDGLDSVVNSVYGNNHRNLSVEEEAAFLQPFKEQAEQGHVIEASEIKCAYEAKVGHTVGGGQIYNVLRRQGWRKVMPRSRHPKKADDEAIDASKKLMLESEK